MAVSQTFALDRLSAQIRLCRFALLAASTQTVFMREIGSTLFLSGCPPMTAFILRSTSRQAISRRR